MNQQLMPSIWKGHTDEGKVSHRIQIIGDDNKPVMFCSKAHVDRITHIMDRFAGALCLRCPWEVS